MISWRNPDARHADWDLDTYGRAILDGDDRRARRSPAPGAHLGARVLLRRDDLLDADGPPRRHRRARPGRVVQPDGDRARPGQRAGVTSALLSHEAAAASTRASREKGYLDGRALAEVFAWLRPNDLIWNYWVNNYLHGPRPHGVRHPLLERRPGADDRRPCTATSWTSRCATPWWSPAPATMLGTPVDLGKIDRRRLRRRRDRRPPVQVGVLLPDHPAVRRRDQVRALHQRPHRGHGQPARQPQGQLPDRGREPGRTPTDWLAAAAQGPGSWWEDYVAWLAERTAASSAPSRASSATRRTRRCATLPAPMSTTAEPPPRPARPATPGGATRPHRSVRGLQARVSVRPGAGRGPASRRCCCATGSGPASRRCSRSWTALDPDRGVVRFDVPGVGG